MAKILIVDDAEDIVDMLTLILRVNKHEVDSAVDYPGTVKSITSFKPDLVLLDVMFGVTNGKDICRQIKKNFPRLAVVLMSTSSQLLTGFNECNADAAIEKPFDLYELNKVIDSLLENKLQDYIPKKITIETSNSYND